MADVKSESKPGVLYTLQRGLRLLETIATEQGEATAKSLSNQTGIRLGTTYHLLRTLREEGYITRFAGGRYGVGPRLAFLLDTTHTRIAPDPRLVDVLRELHSDVNETAYVTGWYGHDLALQHQIEGGHAVTVRGLQVGYRINPHARSSCKAILAALSEGQVRSFFAGREFTVLTPETISDVDALIMDLVTVAERGFAVDREEFAEGVCCVGAAFFDHQGFPVGSFAVSVPAVRFDENLGRLASVVVAAAKKASDQLGYPGPWPRPSPLVPAIEHQAV